METHMFRIAGCLAAGVGLLVAITAAQAVAVVPPPALQSTPGAIHAAPDELIGEALFQKSQQAESAENRLSQIEIALASLPRPTRLRGWVKCDQSAIFLTLRRVKESRAAAEECSRLLPDLTISALRLAAVLMHDNEASRAARVLIGALKQDPQSFIILDGDEVGEWLQRLEYINDVRGRDQLILALVKSGYTDAHSGYAGTLAREAIRSLLKSGDDRGAATLLTLFLDPQPGLQMIVGKRYEAIWPDIERWAGGDLHVQRAASIAAAKAVFDRDHENAEGRFAYSEALINAGYFDDAHTLYTQILDDHTKWGDENEVAADAAAGTARLLIIQGRSEESIAVRSRVIAISPPNKYPYVVNLLLNQAAALMELGRLEEAAKLIDETVEKDGRAEPDNLGGGAPLWFDAVRSCINHDRAAAAKVADSRIMNLAAYRLTLSCKGDVAGLTASVINELSQPDYKDELVYRLRLYQIDGIKLNFPSDRAWSAVAKSPALAARLDALSRPIPPIYRAAALRWQD